MGDRTSLTYSDHSITDATGASQTLLGVKNLVRDRLIYNSGSNDWWINLVGGTASAGGSGCVKLIPGASLSGPFCNAVTGLGTEHDVLTVLEAT